MNRNNLTQILTMVLLAAFLAITGCGGGSSDTAAPAEVVPPPQGDTGPTGPTGPPGAPGAPGAPGGNVQIQNFHGSSALRSKELATVGKYYADAAIISATADPAGVVTVNFTVKNAGTAVTGITGVSFNIDKLIPKTASSDPNADAESYNQWVPYIYRSETATAGDWPNQSGSVNQSYRESNGTLTDHGDGSYTYVFSTNIASVVTPVGSNAISYDRSLTHRVSLMMGGQSGPTADAVFDFVPDGSAVTETRNIVATAACQNCHGREFHGHGGDRISVENCVTCHNSNNMDAQSGNTLDLKVMIHKIHIGGELSSIPGPDGMVWDDPATMMDESADNGQYAIWGYNNTKAEWWKADFPAVIENCTKCHQGTQANVDNWKNVPSRAACGSCHDNVNFATGINHGGGPQTNDNLCGICHRDGGVAPSVAVAHDWTSTNPLDPGYDPRNIPEFTAAVSLDTPVRGYYIAGESPVVTVKLTGTDGSAFDHTTMVEDYVASPGVAAEGCLTTGCPPNDGKFTAASLFVHGPRGQHVPALTMAARAAVLSSTIGPFDISAASAALILKVDQGIDLLSTAGGGTTKAGTITVAVSAGTFVSKAAATTDEIVTWLNANAAFKARAIAYNQSGMVGIRSRNLGRVYGIQLQTSAVATAVFPTDATAATTTGVWPIHMPTGSTASNNMSHRSNPTAVDDPKVTRSADKITYALDPVDDLAPGTYVVNVEIADRGRVDATNYKTPTVAKVPFQVKTATEELAPAGNCGSCHESQGKGLVFDPARHHKILDNTAVDQCGACHDYMPQTAVGAAWSGAIPIARRVHAVHNGANLTYPLLTVSHADEPVGRLWDITFPQDVRNCETCHPAGTTSGSWATKPARVPCMGCHDTDEAAAHMKVMTYDPTPADAWSGDEQESCKACH